MTLNRCVLDSVLNLNVICGLILLDRSLPCSKRLFTRSYVFSLTNRFKVYEESIREILGIIISWTNTPTVYLLFHDRHWNQMGVSNVATTIIAVTVMIFLHLRDSDSDLRHCMLDWWLFRLASGGRKKEELSQALDFLSVSKKKSIRAHNDYEMVDMAAEGSEDLSVGNQELSTRPAVAKCGETGEAPSSATEVVTPREKRKNSLWWRANARNISFILFSRWEWYDPCELDDNKFFVLHLPTDASQ